MSSNGSLQPASNGSSSLVDPDRAVNALTRAAQIVLRRRFRVALLVRDAYDRMTANDSVLEAVWEDLVTMLRLLTAWAARSYERVSWGPLVLIAAAVLYFVLPFDVVPDLLAGIGFVDDVSVVTTVVQSVRSELDRFRDWDAAQ